MKKLSLLAAFAVCAAMFVCSAVPVRAAEKYAAIRGGTVKLTHELVMDKNAATVHDAKFTFTVAGSNVSMTGDPAYLYEGPEGATVTGSLTYSDADVAGAAVDEAAGKKTATKEITVNFSNVEFTEVGIYRFAVTQTLSGGSHMDPDPDSTRYIDIAVTDDGANKLTIKSVVVRTSGNNKSDRFTNAFTANTLTVSKTVAGNQSSKNKYFRFTVTLTQGTGTAIDDSTGFDVSGLDTAIEPEVYATAASATAASATQASPNAYPFAAMNDANSADFTYGSLKNGQDFYLKSGQSFVIRDIPKGYGYTVTEAPENYSPSVTVTGDTSCEKESAGAVYSVTDDELTAYTALSFTNTREAPISAGLVIAVAVPALLLLTGAAGAGVILSRKRRGR